MSAASPAAIAAAQKAIQSAFPGQLFFSITQAAAALNIAERTLRNRLVLGTSPVATTTIGGHRVVPLPALVEYVASRFEDASETAASPPAGQQKPPAKRGPGRPRRCQQQQKEVRHAG